MIKFNKNIDSIKNAFITYGVYRIHLWYLKSAKKGKIKKGNLFDGTQQSVTSWQISNNLVLVKSNIKDNKKVLARLPII